MRENLLYINSYIQQQRWAIVGSKISLIKALACICMIQTCYVSYDTSWLSIGHLLLYLKL